MVSVSNGSLSGEVSNKRPLEYGCMPKYKPRKISAVRKFPPGCGPNAVPINLRPEGNYGSRDPLGVVTSVVANGVGTSVIAEAVGNSDVGIAKLGAITDSEIQTALDPNTSVVYQSREEVGHWAGVNGSIDVHMTEKLDELETGPPLETQLQAELHRQEGVDNPIEVERDEELHTYTGKVVTTVVNGLGENKVEEAMPESDLFKVDIVNDMKILNDPGEFKEDSYLASLQNSGVEVASSPLIDQTSAGKNLFLGIQPETSIRPKDKYRPRRVSAVRQFPPHCGTNASLPIEEKDSLNKPVKLELTPEPSISTTVSEIGGKMSATSGECLDGLHNIHVEIEKSELLKDDAGRGLLGEITVATKAGDPTDFGEYSSNLQHGINERSEASPATMKSSIKDARGPVGKDSKRELVHGLVAAPHCIWRKSKAVLDTPDGGRDGRKVREQNVPLRQKPKADALNSLDLHDEDESPSKSTFIDEGDHGASSGLRVTEATPVSMFKAEVDSKNNDYSESVGKDVFCSPTDGDEGRNSHNPRSKDDVDGEVVHGLMAAPKRKEKVKTTSISSGGKKRKQNSPWQRKGKAVARKSNPQTKSLGTSSKKKKNQIHISNDVDEGPDALNLADDGDHDGNFATNSPASIKRMDFEINLPRFGPNSSDDRNKVRRILWCFHTIYRKYLQLEEAKPVQGRSEPSGKKSKRIDLFSVQILKNKGEALNTTKMIGPVPGVEVGDEFQYRVELAIVGIHFPYQSGIDSMKVNDVLLATSIVTSGAYSDDVENADVLIYSGQGGNVIGKSKEPEDQKLERGNLALKNCIESKTPVRVVRGWKETKYVDPLDTKPKMVTTYVYDGLYTVTNYWTEEGPRGKQVFMFELKRNPGQPELAWKELKKSSKSKTRPGVCVADISKGQERIPICAVNTVDDEKPPPFNYTLKMIYPKWHSPSPPEGCSCTGRCSKSKKCKCAIRNEGDIPYNNNGALVETKPLVYECGPHCKCPPSCYNRVTQRGIKFQLEVFKTDSRGWGVRALTSIPSGSFICEYSGELLEEKEAEERVGSDEYLFDIGQNLIDSSTNPEEQETEVRAEKGYTIDALTHGNVGRFINHSCLPNLHAQNVIYDNDDERMPHIMLFAMENIPPLTELTYHYNYSLGQIYDSDGNVKEKKCYCGAAGCSGRMY